MLNIATKGGFYLSGLLLHKLYDCSTRNLRMRGGHTRRRVARAYLLAAAASAVATSSSAEGRSLKYRQRCASSG